MNITVFVFLKKQNKTVLLNVGQGLNSKAYLGKTIP